MILQIGFRALPNRAESRNTTCTEGGWFAILAVIDISGATPHIEEMIQGTDMWCQCVMVDMWSSSPENTTPHRTPAIHVPPPHSHQHNLE
jgi:hypothetical protein